MEEYTLNMHYVYIEYILLEAGFVECVAHKNWKLSRILILCDKNDINKLGPIWDKNLIRRKKIFTL